MRIPSVFLPLGKPARTRGRELPLTAGTLTAGSPRCSAPTAARTSPDPRQPRSTALQSRTVASIPLFVLLGRLPAKEGSPQPCPVPRAAEGAGHRALLPGVVPQPQNGLQAFSSALMARTRSERLETTLLPFPSGKVPGDRATSPALGGGSRETSQQSTASS